jgi:hypothetical protein
MSLGDLSSPKKDGGMGHFKYLLFQQSSSHVNALESFNTEWSLENGFKGEVPLPHVYSKLDSIDDFQTSFNVQSLEQSFKSGSVDY